MATSYEELFSCPPLPPTAEEQILATGRGEKPIFLGSFGGNEKAEERGQHLARLALENGLCVIQSPYPFEDYSESTLPSARLLIAPPEQLGRVSSLIEVLDMKSKHPWSDAIEHLASRLLGYSPESTEVWLERSRQAGWGGWTLHMLIPGEGVEQVKALAGRCFPLEFDPNQTVSLLVRRHVTHSRTLQILPENMSLARFCVSDEYLKNAFTNLDELVPDVFVRVGEPRPVQELNAALRSNIQHLTKDGWKQVA